MRSARCPARRDPSRPRPPRPPIAVVRRGVRRRGPAPRAGRTRPARRTDSRRALPGSARCRRGSRPARPNPGARCSRVRTRARAPVRRSPTVPSAASRRGRRSRAPAARCRCHPTDPLGDRAGFAPGVRWAGRTPPRSAALAAAAPCGTAGVSPPTTHSTSARGGHGDAPTGPSCRLLRSWRREGAVVLAAEQERHQDRCAWPRASPDGRTLELRALTVGDRSGLDHLPHHPGAVTGVQDVDTGDRQDLPGVVEDGEHRRRRLRASPVPRCRPDRCTRRRRRW